MNQKISISIEKPCSENFNNFVKTDEGSYCSSCQKVVVDFTKMNDQEILSYFDNQSKKTCGVFLESQLKTYSNFDALLNKQKSTSFVSSVFGFSLFSLLSFSSIHAQDKTKENETVKVEKDIEEQKTESLEINMQNLIKGIVSDSTGPLPSANVVLKGTNIAAQTDLDGKFTFPKPLQSGDILVVSFIGLDDYKLKITKETLFYVIKLKDNQMITMGEVNTNKVYKSKRTFLQKVKSVFTNE